MHQAELRVPSSVNKLYRHYARSPNEQASLPFCLVLRRASFDATADGAKRALEQM
jgi:hypothetical protein